MDDQKEFTGTHAVVLPKDYLQSLEAATELYEDQLASQPGDLTVESLRPDRPWHLFGSLILGLLAWLAPVYWMTCS